jgi:hypothetical protein
MRSLPQREFDFYILSRPRGYAFGDHPPMGFFCSDDGQAFASLTRCERTGYFGVECMRRRVDSVWTLTRSNANLMRYVDAMTVLEQELASGRPPLPAPPGEPVRPALAKLGPKGASAPFQLLSSPSHHPAAWAINQVYLAFPRPDRHWARDFQTGNFHTRLWEAYLLACFREQGCLVKQEHPSPDFWIGRRGHGHAWIEAVTANDVPYEHVIEWTGQLPDEPVDPIERQIGAAAVRFAKTIRSKLQKGYTEKEHVRGQPFAIAIADFHAPGSMVWTREALMAYLYGAYAIVEETNGKRAGIMHAIEELQGEDKIPAGLFRRPESAKLSAIVFSNAATIAKFNRMGFLAGVRPPGLHMFRAGSIFDRRPGRLEPIPFFFDISSAEYTALWPGSGETWSLEMDVFHNPLAEHPFPYELLPECSHWMVDADGDIGARAFHQHTILSSRTQIFMESEEMEE